METTQAFSVGHTSDLSIDVTGRDTISYKWAVFDCKDHSEQAYVTSQCAKSLESFQTRCNPLDYREPVGSPVHGILQARILEWVALPSSRGSSLPRHHAISLMSPALAGGFFTTSATWKAHVTLQY